MRIAMVLITLGMLGGCADFESVGDDFRWTFASKEEREVIRQERIAVWTAECKALGASTEYMVECIQRKQALFQQGQTNSQQQFNHDNHHRQQQILNHGAGGCTPNFSTGGCL